MNAAPVAPFGRSPPPVVKTQHPPADATRMSGPAPICATACSMAALTSERRRTSHCTRTALRPRASTSAATAASFSSSAMSAGWV